MGYINRVSNLGLGVEFKNKSGVGNINHIEIQDNSFNYNFFQPNSGDFTINCWVNVDDFLNANIVDLETNNPNFIPNFIVYLNNNFTNYLTYRRFSVQIQRTTTGLLRFICGFADENSKVKDVDYQIDLVDFEYRGIFMLSWVKSGLNLTDWQIYFNGVLLDEIFNFTKIERNVLGDISVFAYDDVPKFVLGGWVDDFSNINRNYCTQIFNRVLTDSEIQHLYNYESSLPSSIISSDIILNYHFNKKRVISLNRVNGVIEDFSENNNNGDVVDFDTNNNKIWVDRYGNYV